MDKEKKHIVNVGQFLCYIKIIKHSRKHTDVEEQALDLYEIIKGMKFSGKARQMSLQAMLRFEQMESEGFLGIHRVNYALMTAVGEMEDYVESRGLLKRLVKYYNKKVNLVFAGYKRIHRSGIRKDSWVAFQDSMRIATDILDDSGQILRENIRDHLIMHRNETEGHTCDIPMIVHAEFCFLLFEYVAKSYSGYIRQAYEDTGIDFNGHFGYAELQAAMPYFASMCNALGIRTSSSHGFVHVAGLSLNSNMRYSSAYKQYIDTICDNHLLEDACLQAFEFTPSVKANYEAIIAEEKKQKMDDALQQLRERYNINNIKSVKSN